MDNRHLLIQHTELDLIQRALWAGSDDQSLWFYHQYLMSTFLPTSVPNTIVPDLTVLEKTFYIRQEIERVQEMLDGADDCKWIYLTLIQLSSLHRDLTNQWPFEIECLEGWVSKLIQLDPLRRGKYLDLKKRLC